MPDAPFLTCRACSTQVPSTGKFCFSCGATLSQPGTAELTPTEYMPAPTTPASVPASDDERFPPGTLIAGRYRIASQLGRGGMGEVYRATDLVLRQPVALKFLPQAAGAATAVLERFLNEVRIARQISHANVCRVYDIGVHEGLHYISMEYVDGEDLSSLLRRIGRLPGDKALEFARRICAGLAAAHDKGVLHRDLKPANIMIDGQGQVRIMDFGLAGWSGQFQGAEIRSGTPGYMAPEQMRGEEVTARSDIYSLGVVLYEMFTGKRAFEAATVAELSRMQSQATPVSPATMVKDLDPAVEMVILRCLDPDPARRPASAIAVAAALPGGDPLAAALAAGETPSPELVAAAGEKQGVRLYQAVIALSLALIGVVICALASGRLSIVSRIPFENPPEALASRGREILRSLGYTERPVDTAFGLRYHRSYLRYVDRSSKSPNRWAALANGNFAPVTFWYRTSPRMLVTSDFFSSDLAYPGVVDSDDPPTAVPGMIGISLDTQGRLTGLNVVAPDRETPAKKPAPVDWKPLLDATGLDQAHLTSAEPEWLPAGPADTRAAWTGTYPGSTERVRLEAAGFRGRVTYVRAVGPWSESTAAGSGRPSSRRRTIAFIVLGAIVLGILGSCVMARRNMLLGRGDAHGASRLAGFVFVVMIAAWALGASHVPDLVEIFLAMIAASRALFMAALTWVLYLALEPYTRRLWPQTLISWSRALTGGWRDPLVSRDVLFGMTLGIIRAVLYYAQALTAERAGGDLRAMETQDLVTLFSARHLGAEMIVRIPNSVTVALMLFLFMFALRTALRRQWAAVGVFTVMMGLIGVADAVSGAGPMWATIVFTGLGIATFLIALLRYGLLGMVSMLVVANALIMTPMTLDFSAWYSPYSLFTVAVCAGIAIIAFRNAIAGRPAPVRN